MEGLSGMFPHSPIPDTPGAGSTPQEVQQQIQATASANAPPAPSQRSSSLLTDVIGRVNNGRY
jgi:hypothetical protein